MKKAQTEIIGLVIIVILLIIGAIFLVSFNSNKKKINSQSTLDPKLADNFLYAILNTKTEKNLLVIDVIKDCYQNKHDLCGTTTTADCCAYAEQTIKNALEATLGNWSRSYRLYIRRDNEKRINDLPENSKCQGKFIEKEQSGIYYIPPPPLIIVTLDICKT
ncbi:MAG: hypothetical protein QXM96_03925 [Candidatus Woesearchaeota archaeon]